MIPCVKKLCLTACFLFSTVLVGTSAWALPTDKDQPIHVQARTAKLDEKRGVVVYEGNVVITQGTTIIKGDTVTLQRNAKGELDIVTAVGNTAYYEQKPAVDKPVIKAYALTIQYFALKDQIILQDKARVIQGKNTSRADKIVYDVKRQLIHASGTSGVNMVFEPDSPSNGRP